MNVHSYGNSRYQDANSTNSNMLSRGDIQYEGFKLGWIVKKEICYKKVAAEPFHMNH